jgi:hypothetical protein
MLHENGVAKIALSGLGDGSCRSSVQLLPAVMAALARRTFGGRVAARASRFPPFDPVREAGARTDNALHTGRLIATFHCGAPTHCRAFADEGRIVAGDEDRKSIPSKRWFSNSI